MPAEDKELGLYPFYPSFYFFLFSFFVFLAERSNFQEFSVKKFPHFACASVLLEDVFVCTPNRLARAFFRPYPATLQEVAWCHEGRCGFKFEGIF